MKERKTYSSPKVTGLSVICVILTLILTILLLVCMTAHHIVYQTQLPKAASALELDKMVLSYGGQKIALSKLVQDEFIQDDRVTEEQVQNVLREGTFPFVLGEKVYAYNNYLVSGGTVPFPEVSEEEFVQMIEVNGDLIQQEVGLRFLDPDKAKLKHNMQDFVAQLNDKLHLILEDGVPAFFVHAAISEWIWIVLTVLLVLVMVWLIVIHSHGQKSVGKALRVFSITGFIPCILLLLWGVLCAGILGLTEGAYLRESAKELRGSWMMVGGISALVYAAIFGVSMILNPHAKKTAPLPEQPEFSYDPIDTVPPEEPAPIPEPEPEPVPESEPRIIRRYCRFCGQPLVNTDAKFCYKCGTTQENVNSDSE